MSDLSDPRVLFAAERTLMAWNRTSISLMAFGFVIERFGLLLRIAGMGEAKIFHRDVSFLMGLAFILLASFLSIYSARQHNRIIKTLKPVEIPAGYNIALGMITSMTVGVFGLLLSVYLVYGFL